MEDIKEIKFLKGIKTPKKYIINNLQDYISKLSSIETKEYYFRGESKYYMEITASGLRDDNVDYRRKLPFNNLIKKYYNEVGQRLSDIDRKAFTAFSQHHGIPTNLVDITTSPLISLYFACQESSSDTGFVYLIDKKNTIDITERIYNSENIHVNIIDLLSSKNPNNIKENYIMFKELFLDNVDLLEYFLYKIIDDYKFYDIYGCLKKDDINFLSKAIKEYSSLLQIDGISRNDIRFVDIRDKYSEKTLNLIITLQKEFDIILDMKIDSYEEVFIYSYYLLIKKFLLEIKEIGESVHWFNCIPIFTYNPMSEFQRIKNQQGLFIHQGYQLAHEQMYDCSVFTRQRIWMDKVFVIKNKEEILRQLDNLGINEKFVFYDFDSIASYIKTHNL